MATHSSVLAWRIPGTVEPRGLPSMGSHRVGHDWSDLAAGAAALVMKVTSVKESVKKASEVWNRTKLPCICDVCSWKTLVCQRSAFREIILLSPFSSCLSRCFAAESVALGGYFSKLTSLSSCSKGKIRYVPLLLCWLLSHVWLFMTPCTESFRQEYRSGLPFLSPGATPAIV